MSLWLDKTAWKRGRLGDLVRRSRTQTDPLRSGIERYVGGGHIDTDGVTIERWGNVDDGQMGSTFRYVFEPGQVLFVSARPYLRKTGVPDFSGVVADKTYVLDALRENGLLQEFLPFVLSSDAFIGFATAEATGSMNPRLLWGPMQRFEFEVPPLDEQKRLSDLLWAIENHQRALPSSALRAVETQLLRELFSPLAAPSRPVASVGTVLMGRQRSPEHEVGEHLFPYLRVANVGDNELKLEDVKVMNFTPDEQQHYSVRPNDILISEGQSRELVGQSVLVADLPEPMCFQNTLIRFRPDPNLIRPGYAQALFRACLRTGRFADIATQTTSIAHLGLQRFAQLRLPVPDLAQQDEFLERYSSIRSAAEAIDAELVSLRNLTSGILGEIFGGTE